MARCATASQVHYHLASRAMPLKRRDVGRRDVMRYDVKFRSTFPVDMEGHPIGEELARHIFDQLVERGIVETGFDNYDDFAWVLWTKKPFVLLGYVGDDVFEWLIQIASNYGAFRRAFGASDDDERETIARALDEVLHSDPAIRDVRWHEGEFSDEGWTEHPA